MKKAGVSRGSRHVLRGTAVEKKSSNAPSRKGRGTSTTKVKKQPVTPVEVQDKKGGGSIWTKKDEMARRIQTSYKGYRCRKLFLDLKKKKTDYDELMGKLQKEAYVQMVKLEQLRAEAERKREDEEKKKRKEHSKRVTRMLEAAFDGDTIEISSILEEVRKLCSDQGEEMVARSQYMLIECTDANRNTPLSEAAAGGDEDTIRLLVSLEANPNSKGQYGRTPLYRAAFAGHHKAVEVLLQSGADPRLTAEDGERPDQVASNFEVESVLNDWKIDDTERLLEHVQVAQKKRMESHGKLVKAVGSRLKDAVDVADRDYYIKQRQLTTAHEELNKRISEHDKNMTTGAIKTDITLAVVHDAEDHLEHAKLEAEAARKTLSEARLQLRLQRKEFENDSGSGASIEDSSDVTINIRELDDVLMKDVGKKIAESGKWPLIVDPGKQAATFLRYRDTNYMNCCNPARMEPNILRLALLGALKYGKFIVLDMLDIDGLWTGIEQHMNLVQKDLLKAVMDMSLIKENKFQSLTRESDGDEYSAKALLSARVHDFKLVVLTQLLCLPKEFTEQFYVIRIHISNSN